MEPIFPLTSNVISIDQFGSPNPSPIIFSDFAMNFDPTVQSDYGVVDLVITVTGPSCILGDVDMNGVVDFNDIPEFLSVLLGSTFNAKQMLIRTNWLTSTTSLYSSKSCSVHRASDTTKTQWGRA